MKMFSKLANLMADADDLILSIGTSADPELQALKTTVAASIEDIKRETRRRIRDERYDHRTPQRVEASRDAGGTSGMAVGISLIAIVLAGIFVGRRVYRSHAEPALR